MNRDELSDEGQTYTRPETLFQLRSCARQSPHGAQEPQPPCAELCCSASRQCRYSTWSASALQSGGQPALTPGRTPTHLWLAAAHKSRCSKHVCAPPPPRRSGILTTDTTTEEMISAVDELSCTSVSSRTIRYQRSGRRSVANRSKRPPPPFCPPLTPLNLTPSRREGASSQVVGRTPSSPILLRPVSRGWAAWREGLGMDDKEGGTEFVCLCVQCVLPMLTTAASVVHVLMTSGICQTDRQAGRQAIRREQ